MTKSILIALAFIFTASISKAQTTAANFIKKDCNGTMHNLFNDLDAGKVVLLHFFMSNCGSCPPPAQKIQAMAKNVMKTYPGSIIGYAVPFNNSTTCSYASTWVSSNNLTLYTPLDSGADMVSYYGGFGMPTVVMLGGKDHKILFSTMSFSTEDTTTMRDSALAFLQRTTGLIHAIKPDLLSLNLYPNPANDKVQLELNLKQSSTISIDVMNVLGEVVANVYQGNVNSGLFQSEVKTNDFKAGVYFLSITADQEIYQHKFIVNHSTH
jgi:thiol-disulfide isomerase/thioredoxin